MPNTERPLSPHLQVYRPQLTSMLSILHRITGVGLALGAVVLTWWLFAAVVGGTCWEMFESFRTSIIGQVMLFGWLFSYVYHFFNGIRHLKWDTGHGLTIQSVYRSGWVAIIGSVIVTLFIWFLGAY